MNTEIVKVKLGVYDLEDNFLGYKSDTFWTLDTWYKEHHYLDEERLIDNLIHILNNKPETEALVDLLLQLNDIQMQLIKKKNGCIIKSQRCDNDEVLRIFQVYEDTSKRVKWSYKEIKEGVENE